ncbi:porin [Schlegelella sp. S2-27]|uniref:Porin n=1 Tax=Caldimonas mangrovi TaxID=2944811 RepID=A0ABT0YLY0_9BURK|nr:porin [Caldimonas mangrovi]MCM5679156.1 porin [Caldimonas mangrovi]
MKFRLSTPVRATVVACLTAAAWDAHAQSSAQLYGLMDVFVGSLENSGTRRLSKVDSGGMTTSYIGIKGAEDLGGGLSAQFAIESFLRADTGEAGRFGPDAFWARSAYVGFAGSLGTLRYGRNTNPTFVTTLVFNPFGDSFGFSPAIRNHFGGGTGQVAGDTGWSNSVAYLSPRFGGLSASLLYSIREAAQGANFGGSLTYFAGPLGLAFAAQQVKVPFAAGKETTYQLNGSYDFGIAKAYGQYTQVKEDDTGSTVPKNQLYQLGASAPVGAGSVLASWGHANSEPTAGDDIKRNTASLGYDHFLSKRTDLYAIYMHDRVKGEDAGNSFAVGIRHRY